MKEISLNMKKIAILGATGSVGTQALDVAEARGYEVELISANSNIEATVETAKKFRPRYVAVADASAADSVRSALSGTGIKVFSGDEGIIEAIGMSDAETVVNSITLPSGSTIPVYAVS